MFLFYHLQTRLCHCEETLYTQLRYAR